MSYQLNVQQIFRATVQILLGLVLVCHSLQGFAQKENHKAMPDFEAGVELSALYDDNILAYSDQYIQRFINNEDPGRFHIETYDDIILNPSIQLLAGYTLFGKMRSELDVNLSSRLYMVNDIKNWNYFSIGFRQYFAKRASFKLIYSYIPDFYIRHYQDDDWVAVYGNTPEKYQPMEFSKNSYGLWIQNTFFQNTTLRLSFYYYQYFYNKHFTEYDCNDLNYRVKLYQPLGDRFKLELGYEYTSSKAKGYDDPGETSESSDESDASYFENGFYAGLTWKMPRLFKHSENLDVEGAYSKRYYLSEHYIEQDPLHVGRMDNNYGVNVSYKYYLSRRLYLSLFYEWTMRDAETSSDQNSTYVSNEKDFRQNRYGLAVNYNLNYKISDKRNRDGIW